MSHTPAPWCVTHEDQKRTIFCIAGPIGNGQARFLAKIPRRDTEEAEAEANARLICAAPDLLGALQEAVYVLRKIKPDTYGNGTIIRGQRAISKATGEQA